MASRRHARGVPPAPVVDACGRCGSGGVVLASLAVNERPSRKLREERTRGSSPEWLVLARMPNTVLPAAPR